MIAKTDSSLLLALSYVSHFEPKNGVFVVYLLRLMFRDYKSFKFAKLLNQHSVHPCSDVYPRGLKSHTWSSGLVGGDITLDNEQQAVNRRLMAAPCDPLRMETCLPCTSP